MRGEVGAEGTDASDTVIFDELLIFSDLCLFVGFVRTVIRSERSV